MFTRFIQDMNSLNLSNSYSSELVLHSIRLKFPTLFNLSSSISNHDSVFKLFIFIIQGWFSLFYIILYFGADAGKNIIRLSLIKSLFSKAKFSFFIINK